MKPLAITSGEPAGIGPDICIGLAKYSLPVVILGDEKVLAKRAEELGVRVTFNAYDPNLNATPPKDHLSILSISCPSPVKAGALNPQNASYVLEMLQQGTDRCLSEEFSGLVTAPVHKGIINKAGNPFTGHTEFLESRCRSKKVVMLLSSPKMRVALVTTHLPLRRVADAITQKLLTETIKEVDFALKNDFAIKNPRLHIAGLNPHAGETGYLGKEEIEIISPTIKKLQTTGINVHGPFPADTMFTPSMSNHCDAYIAMYHDQGLSVIKYADFSNTVNVTLGLPIIRTSVDHGTALELAGTGRAEENSLVSAVQLALKMASHREKRKCQ